MPPLLLILAALLVWAWATGRLRNLSFEDAMAAVLFLVGVRLFATERLLVGGALMAGSALWTMHRHKRANAATMPADEARALLGLGPESTLAEIRDAHRRLIRRVHPDAGGSTELANRINTARDTLVSELNRQPRRAS